MRGNPWRVYELSRFYPPLFHVLAVPASFFSTHPDAYASGNWIALLAAMACTFFIGRVLAGIEAGVVAALILPAFGWVTWMGRMAMTDLTLTATVALTLALLVRPLDLAAPRDARRLGLAIALGLLAKWPYVLFVFLPLAQLVHAHWRATRRELRARPFWRPLVTVVAWPLVLAGPWYVRSVPSLLGQASWHLGSGVALDEGDPAPLGLEALAYYPRQLWTGYLSVPLLLLLVAGVAALLLRSSRGAPREIAPATRWTPLALALVGGVTAIVLITNKDPRYLMPLMPIVAVVAAAWVPLLDARRRTRALVACAVLSWLLVLDTLFRVSPPDRTDWKVADTAAILAPRLARADGTAPKILVVPNDLQMNSNALAYALQRITPAKVVVERAYGVPGEEKLRELDFAVVVEPPPDETAVSRDSIAAARTLLARPDWGVTTRLARGDGREILILEPRPPAS